MKNLTFLWFSIILMGCDPITKKLEIVNTSDKVKYCRIMFDTALIDYIPIPLEKLLPRQSFWPTIVSGKGKNFWADYINKYSIDSTLYIYFCDKNQIVDSTVYTRNYQRIDLKVRDLDSLNWRVNYGNSNKKESALAVKAILRGDYNLLENKNCSPMSDSIFYFLIDVQLINNTNSSVEFLAYNCATAANIVVDSRNINTCFNNCISNNLTIIELKPKQVFSLSVILRANKEKTKNLFKVGWVFLTEENTVWSNNFSSKLENCRKKLENVIWSDPVNFQSSQVKPYEIK